MCFDVYKEINKSVIINNFLSLEDVSLACISAFITYSCLFVFDLLHEIYIYNRLRVCAAVNKADFYFNHPSVDKRLF